MGLRIIPCRFTVPFDELDGSPVENVSRGRIADSTRTFKCATAGKAQLTKEFLGYTESVGGNTIIHRPHTYKSITKIISALAASAKPFGNKMGADAGDSRFASYINSELEISYGIPQADEQESETYRGNITFTETLTAAGEFITVSEEGLFWAGGVALTGLEAPGKISNLEEWTIDIRNVLYVPPAVWGYPGHVNVYEVYSRSLNRWFPKETLLCCSPSVSRETTYDTTVFNISLRFVYKYNGLSVGGIPQGWNHFAHPSVAGGGNIKYDRIVDIADNIKIFYPLADFRFIVP